MWYGLPPSIAHILSTEVHFNVAIWTGGGLSKQHCKSAMTLGNWGQEVLYILQEAPMDLKENLPNLSCCCDNMHWVKATNLIQYGCLFDAVALIMQQAKWRTCSRLSSFEAEGLDHTWKMKKALMTCALLSPFLASSHADRGDWLCKQVYIAATNYPDFNVIGFADGHLRAHNVTSIRDAAYPENCIKRSSSDAYAWIAAGKKLSVLVLW